MQQSEIDLYLKAGEIAKQVVDFAKGFISEDMNLEEIADKIEGKIVELGGVPAFPVNLSIDEVAAHYTPVPGDEDVAGGLLKVDLGVSVEGFIADTAFSLDLSEEGVFNEMIEINEKALNSALDSLGVGSPVSKVGEGISNVVKGTGFTIIKNLTGHELGENSVHAGLTIPNTINGNSRALRDIAFAVEPFLTEGVGEVYEGKPSDIFMLVSGGNVRDASARKILKFIKENYSTRPFCSRWLVKEGFEKVAYSLKLLAREGILHNFPVLVEKSKKPVSQAEHTILITDKVYVSTR